MIYPLLQFYSILICLYICFQWHLLYFHMLLCCCLVSFCFKLKNFFQNFCKERLMLMNSLSFYFILFFGGECLGNIFLLLIKKKVLLGIVFLTSIILFFNTLDIPFYSLLFYNVFAEIPTDNYTRGTMVCDNLPFFSVF